MLTDGQLETVLISTSPHPTGRERLVVAFRTGQDLFVPLDSGRAANTELLDASQLFVREIDSQDEYALYDVQSHRVISSSDRERLETYVGKPISKTTEVLHITGTHVSVGRLLDTTSGFVAVIDGSARALRALGPAIELSRWYGRPLSICAVTAGPDDLDTPSAIRLQLEGTGYNLVDVHFIEKPNLEAYLFEQMRQGQILVASAFGVWAADGRLHGMLNGLVKHNAPAIIGIGPKVPPDWTPSAKSPLVVCVDGSEHAHDLVDQIDPFVTPPRCPVKVVHVATEPLGENSIAHQIACELHTHTGLPVEATVVEGFSVPGALTAAASALDAQLLIMNSWHRPESGHPVVSSTSLTSVAHAPCPVAILSSP